MNHVGQCPACHTRYELEASDVGHLVECECGATLFACNASSLPVVPVRCDACGEEYEVGPEDAGHQVECECGQALKVPTVVFRLPIGSGKSAAQFVAEVASEQDASEESASEGDDAGPGIAARTSGDRIERIDSAHDNPRGGDAATQSLGFVVAADPEPRQEKSAASKRKSEAAKNSSRGTWIGLGSVAAFLLFAIGMYIFRKPPSKLKKQRELAQQNDASAEQAMTGDPIAGNADARVDPKLVAEVAGLVNATPRFARANVASSTNPMDSATLAADGAAGEPSSKTSFAEPDAFPIPAAPLYALPKPTQPKKRVPVSTERVPRMTINSGVSKAFEAYEETQALQEKAEASGTSADLDAYHKSLGKTLAIVEYVHRLAMQENDLDQINTLRYLLAYLYYSAGHLTEASVLGEAVARWGDKDEPSTKEAAMIALAATQELSESQWGAPEQLGELNQMEAICSVLAKRWPEDTQLDLIWMNLAYLLEAFNHPQRAISIYRRIKEDSPYYADAQIASGLARWVVARRAALRDKSRVLPDALKTARQELIRGLRQKEKQEGELTALQVNVRLTLAQMDLLMGESERAENWLMEEPPGIVNSIAVIDADADDGKTVVTEAVARQIFDALFFVRQQAGDSKGATEVLSKMADVVESSEEQVEARRLAIVKATIDRLKVSKSVSTDQVDRLEGLTDVVLEDESIVPTANLLWLGESYREIGLRAADPETAKRCASVAAELYETAMLRTDFPVGSQQTAQLRRIELLRRSGQVTESLALIEEVLAKTPNVFALQIEAAESLQQLALDSGRISDLKAAIHGPEGFSPIWGWGKLVTSLHAARWSDTGTETHVEQLYRAQYSLGQCRYLLAMQSRDVASRRAELSDIERSIRKILATMDKQNKWQAKFSQLGELVRRGMSQG